MVSSLSKKDIVDAKTLYINGKSIKEIAKKYNVSYNVMYQAIKRKNIL